jgi:hypothetical protein
MDQFFGAEPLITIFSIVMFSIRHLELDRADPGVSELAVKYRDVPEATPLPSP